MKKRGKHFGKFLLHGVIFCTVTVVVLQGAVTLYPLQLFTGWAERVPGGWEPELIPVQAPVQNEAPTVTDEADAASICLTLALQDFAALPYCTVLINGEPAAGFDRQQLELTVQNGDWLEVDAACYNFPVKMEVAASSEPLLQPRLHQVFQVQQGIILLGEVQLCSDGEK